MTENLFQKLEEKMMVLLSEIEDSRKEIEKSRKEIQRLSDENKSLINEKENHARKLQDLISLLESVNINETLVTSSTMQAIKPVLVQG